MLDEKNHGQIYFTDFKNIVQSFAQMWSAALGQPTPVNLRHFKTVFDTFADGKDYFDFEDFAREMRLNPNLLFWFSKPEEALKHRMNDYMGTKQKEHTKLIEQLDTIRDLVEEKFTQLKETMNSCMIVLDTEPVQANNIDDNHGGDMDTPMPPTENNIDPTI